MTQTRKFFICGNFKMNVQKEQIIQIIERLRNASINDSNGK